MILYIRNQSVDRNKWDRCISRSVNEIIYAYSWYLDIVCEDWDALVEGDYESVMPLPYRKKNNITYIYQPFFTQQLGVFSTHGLSPEKTGRFLVEIPDHFRHIELNLNTFNRLHEPSFQVKKNDTYELDLVGHYDSINRRYADNTKRNLRRAQKAGVVISQSTSPDEIVSMFRKDKGKTIRTFKANDYKNLLRLLYQCIHLNVAHAYSAYDHHNQLLSGAIFLESRHKSIFIFSANSAAGRSCGAMTALIDAHIQRFSNHNLTLDFEGSNDQHLARFYKGFGASVVHYQHIKSNRLNVLENAVLKIYKFLKR